MAGFCDETQNWCLAWRLWNGVDPILKERMFGLTGPQGNHGEDVKEYWWYLDGTPTHSWNTWRYHYPQREFPYGDLVAENARRGKLDPEYELVDTGIFDDDRYWVVTVDYAKAAPRDLLMRITVENAGPERGDAARAADVVVPQHLVVGVRRPPEAHLAAGRGPDRRRATPGRARSCWSATAIRSRCSARTRPTTSGCSAAATPRRIRRTASTTTSLRGAATVNPAQRGHQGRTALHGDGAGRRVTRTIRVRMVGVPHPALDVDPTGAAASSPSTSAPSSTPSSRDAAGARQTRSTPRSFPAMPPAEEAMVARQAFAGLLWGKQFFHYDVRRWLTGDPDSAAATARPGRRSGTAAGCT